MDACEQLKFVTGPSTLHVHLYILCTEFPILSPKFFVCFFNFIMLFSQIQQSKQLFFTVAGDQYYVF